MFIENPVGRVGAVFVRPVSRPTVEQKTEVCMGRGGLDTPFAKNAQDYSTTSVFMKPRKIYHKGII